MALPTKKINKTKTVEYEISFPFAAISFFLGESVFEIFS